MTPYELMTFAASAAANKKAVRIVMLDLRGQSDLCEFQMICSGDSERQAAAIAQNIEETLKRQCGIIPLSVEGKQTSQWILLDYGATICHVFFDYIREYYALEQLWPEAKFINPK